MCTAISMNKKEHFFGRNLDLDRSYGEEVCVMPRSFPLNFRKVGQLLNHYAMIGMATVVENTPLFYDGVNEFGLAMAGLNFVGNAHYHNLSKDKDNITPFEFIPWILGKCKTIVEAKALLTNINLVNIPFNEQLPLSSLHWIISDKKTSIVVESRKKGLYIYDNPKGVLTNNPPFEYQLKNLEKYNHLKPDNSNVQYKQTKEYTAFSQGLGAVGLPGDSSSMSRFVRAVFALENSVCDDNEPSCVSQFFHLLSFVATPKGTCVTNEKTNSITVYSSCMNTQKGIYYYTTYDNCQITCVDMHKTDLNSKNISRYPLILKQNIYYQN